MNKPDSRELIQVEADERGVGGGESESVKSNQICLKRLQHESS